MRLGKRYIAIVEHVGGNSDTDRWVDGELHVEVAGANTAHEKFTYPTARHVATIEIDIDDALPVNPPPSLDAQHQHAERMATQWLARYQELCAEVKRPVGTCEKPDEARQMRAVIEAMRPIVEAALKWSKPSAETGVSPVKSTVALQMAITANRPHLGLAMSAWENSQTLAPWELTPAEWSALESVQLAIEQQRKLPTIGVQEIAASAIFKLREQVKR